MADQAATPRAVREAHLCDTCEHAEIFRAGIILRCIHPVTVAIDRAAGREIALAGIAPSAAPQLALPPVYTIAASSMPVLRCGGYVRKALAETSGG